MLCLAAFMAMLDVFVVNVAFTGIGASFAGSSLADRHGRKAGFLVGLTVFTLASVGCAVAPGLWWLVAFRVLQAVGAAALTPAGLGLLLTALPPERRAGAVKVWATTSSFAAALGPVVGGALVELSWNWVFLINVPVGVVAFAAAMRLVPESRDESVTRLPDVPDAVVLAVAIGALALGLVKGGEWGWTGAAALGAFGSRSPASRCWWCGCCGTRRRSWSRPCSACRPLCGRTSRPWCSARRSGRCSPVSSCGWRTSPATARSPPVSRSCRGR
ncbi:MFS transporter [Amycolatopsis thermoflava]|uniref:MFS transporter n=1 Tax=Amycolatopsis thermoflava TaxID=84480 RepID=UPI003819ADB3